MSDSNGTAPGRLSDILLATGLVSQEQVETGLRAQKRTGRLLGETLLDLGFISEDDLGWALSNHLGLPYVEIQPEMLDDTLKTLLPVRLMRDNLLLPILRTGNTLQLAMSDPTHSSAMDEVERLTGLTTSVCLAGAHRISRLLDDWLGPEVAPTETSDDLIFREITRPTNALGPLFIRALRERVREILMDPEQGEVRVRFRTTEGLVEQPRVPRAAYDAMVDRLHTALTAAHPPAPGDSRWSSVMPFAEGTLRLTVTLLKLTDGRCLIMEIEPGPAGGAALDRVPLAEPEIEQLRGLMIATAGLVVVTGTRAPTVRRALSKLVREIDAGKRRVVAMEDALVAPLPGIISLRLPRETTREAFLVGLLEEAHVEVAVAGRLRPGPILAAAATMAACGRLVVAWDLAPDPVTWLATTLEAGAPRTMTSLGLAAIVHAREDAAGALELTTVTNSRGLADAIRAGGDWKSLQAAANQQGFWGRSAA